MAKRISEHVREEAVFLCAIRASNPDISTFDVLDMWDAPVNDEPPQNDEQAAVDLAYEAWDAACAQDFRVNFEHWATAESMLRTGWSPS